nr:MAG TPA: Neck appendage protein [Caudoviricetes sp.]
MDVFRRQKFNEAMFAKNRTLAIRVGQYQSRDINEASFDYGYIKGDTYKPGGTCAGSAKIVFASVITSFNKLDKIYPEIGLLVDGTYEWVKMGEYFINDIEIDRNRKMTKLDLMDGMFKLNREHVTDLAYPAEIRNVIKEICLKTGIELANENMGLASMNYRIEQIPKDKKMTFRDVLSLSTQMLGMSCFFNREGKLEIKELTDSGITITADSYFMHGLTKSEIEYQIAGITCKKDKETLTVGLRTGRSLELDNLFMSQSILDNLYHSIKDIRYYPFSLNYQGHLLLDVGQWVTIKTNTGETFKSPVLSQSFNFKGGLRGRISADSKAGNDAQYSYAGTITKKIEQFNEFEAQLQNQIEEADRGFDTKVDQIKKDFNDQIELAKAKAEENKKALSDEIDRRFHDFSPEGFDEAKRKAEEALKKAGASDDLAQEVKRIASENQLTFTSMFDKVNRQENELAEYKQSVSERIANLSSRIANKADDVNFQRVRETAQLYERILGSSESDISRNASRLVMSNQVFQTEVGKYVTDDNNLIVNSMTMDKNTLVGNNNPKASVSVDEGVFTIKAEGLTGYNWSGFTLPIYVKKVYHGETYTLGFKYRIKEYPDVSFAFNIKNHGLNKTLTWANIGEERPPLNEWQEFQKTFTMQEDFAFGEDYNYPFYIFLAKNGWVEFKEPILVRGSKTGPYKPSQFDDAYKMVEATQTQVTQKLAEYKETSDGRFATISTQISGKVDQSDFQRVKETSQLYERILGTTEQGVADNASRLVMSSQIFQTEVKKLTGSSYNLVFDPTNFSKWKKKQADANVIEVQAGTRLLRITNSGNTNVVYHGFALPLTTSTFTEGEKLSYRMEVWVDVLPDAPLGIELWAEDGGLASDSVTFTKTGIQIITGTMTVQKSSTKGREFPLEIWLMKNGTVAIGKVSLIRGEKPPSEFKDDTSAQDVVAQTKVTQLSDSYAIQTLTNAGAIASQINTNANNILIEAAKIRLKGKTLADEITAIDGYFKRLFVGDARIGTLNTDIIRSNSIAADKLIFDTALAKKLVSSDVFTDTLAAKTAFINKLRSVVVSATLLEGYKGRIGGFQIGTHDKDPNSYWLTGQNQFKVGMGSGNGRWGQTALWVNWGNDWEKPDINAWYVRNDGKMFCYNQAEFWGTPIIHGNLKVSGNIYYISDDDTKEGGYWIHSPSYKRIQENAGYIYLYRFDDSYSWIPINKEISDRRYKHNIEDSKVSALEVIDNLKTYSYRKEYDDKIEDISCGIMAQDVQQVAPEAFFENPDGAYSYNTFALVPYLIKAIQELNQKVERLETTT